MRTLVAFDLDDTLVPEALFLLSGIEHIAHWLHLRVQGIDANRVIGCMQTAVFTHRNHYSGLESLLSRPQLYNGISPDLACDCRTMMADIVDEFRSHRPDPDIYHLSPSMHQILSNIRDRGIATALITDGRSRTQRNKIEAAGLYDFFDNKDIYISEETGHDKKEPDNFLNLMRNHPDIEKFVYVADNPAKDFIHPLRLGWETHLVRRFPLMIHQPGLWYSKIPMCLQA